MNKHLRTGLRFCVYIRAIGGEPVPFRHGSHREWALDLQRQHERLRRGTDPEHVKAAKSSAKALIRQMGYRKAAEEVVPVQVGGAGVQSPCVHCGDYSHLHAPAIADAIDEAQAAERGDADRLAELQCRRKLRHANYWTAVQHALHLGRDVRTYPCPVCEGIHCGHPPESDLTRQYRRARKRLRVIDKRLVALDEEWIALVQEKKALLPQLGEPDVLAVMLGEIQGSIRRLLNIVSLSIWSEPH